MLGMVYTIIFATTSHLCGKQHQNLGITLPWSPATGDSADCLKKGSTSSIPKPLFPRKHGFSSLSVSLCSAKNSFDTPPHLHRHAVPPTTCWNLRTSPPHNHPLNTISGYSAASQSSSQRCAKGRLSALLNTRHNLLGNAGYRRGPDLFRPRQRNRVRHDGRGQALYPFPGPPIRRKK
jgi:hypothetical protein